MNSFQEKDNSLILPCRRDVYLTLIPCNTDIMLLWLKPLKDLYIIRLTVFFVDGVIPPFTEKFAIPPVCI